MPGYVFVNVDVTNPDGYREYAALATIAAHGGRYLARGGSVDVLEGDFAAKRVVILEFASAAAARGWYHSPEYQAIKPLREQNAHSQLLLVSGYDG